MTYHGAPEHVTTRRKGRKEEIMDRPSGRDTAPTPDLLSTLERIESEARRARQKFQRGEVVNGRWSLRRIEEEAGDALVRARERRGTAA